MQMVHIWPNFGCLANDHSQLQGGRDIGGMSRRVQKWIMRYLNSPKKKFPQARFWYRRKSRTNFHFQIVTKRQISFFQPKSKVKTKWFSEHVQNKFNHIWFDFMHYALYSRSKRPSFKLLDSLLQDISVRAMFYYFLMKVLIPNKINKLSIFCENPIFSRKKGKYTSFRKQIFWCWCKDYKCNQCAYTFQTRRRLVYHEQLLMEKWYFLQWRPSNKALL